MAKVNNKTIIKNQASDEQLEQTIQSIPTKTEYCNVIWKNNTGFAFIFKGYGIAFKTHKLDIDLVPDIIEIEYTSDIGEVDFSYSPKFKI